MTATFQRANPFSLFVRAGLALLAAVAFTAGTVVVPKEAAAQRNTYENNRYDKQKAGRKHVAGQFDYYSLVLSWSPTHCASLPRGKTDPQCDVKRSRPYAFVLHGLWPQYTRGYPDRCWTRDRPFVPRKLINEMIDIMPSPKLVIHEYKKHGTCSGLDPDGYYKLSRILFDKIKIPERYVKPVKAQMVSPEKLMEEFIADNPQMRPDMLAVSCGGPGNRLREIRICFSRNGEFQPCGRNENQRRLCNARSMFVPPVR